MRLHDIGPDAGRGLYEERFPLTSEVLGYLKKTMAEIKPKKGVTKDRFPEDTSKSPPVTYNQES